jgi:hypothetical protein
LSERLKAWIKTLSPEKKDELLLLCVQELIDSELFNFYEGHTVPVWDCDGENIDGSEDI